MSTSTTTNSDAEPNAGTSTTTDAEPRPQQHPELLADRSALPDADATAGTIRAVERAIMVLCAFSRETPTLGVTEIAEKLKLTKSTVHRMLQVLLAHGLVAQDPARRQYTLGYRILALAQAVPPKANDLRNICLPHMETVRTATQETVALYVPAGAERICIKELESPQMLRMSAREGRTFPLDRGSSSYALLIDGPDGGEHWRRMNALLDPDGQKKLLTAVLAARAKGYASSDGETVPGAASIAAPIREPDGSVVAALSVGGPSARFTPDAVARYTGSLLEAVARIERDLCSAWAQGNLPTGTDGRADGRGGGRGKGGGGGRM
jgi:DNA-binding IclR family transcriptional regulator